MPILRKKRIIHAMTAICLIAVLLLSSMVNYLPAYANVETDGNQYVTVCIEKKTLGQGYFIEPTLVEIEEGQTAAHALVRLLEANQIDYTYTGSLEEGTFYLSSIKNADTGVIDIPDFISENGGPSNDENDGNSDDYLGEFDYSTMSGWMISVNNEMIIVGSAACEISDGDVVRLAFTTWGYGADLGYSTGWGMESYYQEANRGNLLKAIATTKENAGFMGTNNEAYEAAMEMSLKLEATQQEVDQAAADLNTAYFNYMQLQSVSGSAIKALPYTIDEAVDKTAEYILETVTDPTCGSSGGEWAVLFLARSGKITPEFKETYLNNLTTYIQEKNGVLHSRKLTEYSRVILALSALGVDPTDFAGYNLLLPLSNYENTIWQGINGAVYALIAFDTCNYPIPTIEGEGTQTTREGLIAFILSKEIAGGGWALSGTTPDPDITMMTIQSLSKYYNTNQDVKAAVDRGLNTLSALQKEDGGYASWGTVNCESAAQTICALCSLSIDPAMDTRFIKTEGSWLLSNLFTYAVSRGNALAFAHTGTTINQIATEQAAYALAAYSRFLHGQTGLYDMTDVSETGDLIAKGEATLAVPSNISNSKGETFQVILRTSDIEESVRLLDGVISFSPYLEVLDIAQSNTILGGTLNWNADNGNLRFVLMDIINGSTITSSVDDVQDVIRITFKLKETVPEGVSLRLSLSSFRQVDQTGTIHRYQDNTLFHEITLNRISISSSELFTGDGTDLIPADKKAVKIQITGIANSGKGIGFTCASNDYSTLYKSNDFTADLLVDTYIMIVNKNVTKEELETVENYVVYSEPVTSINFSDTNADHVIDAQDALNTVCLWLRKGDTAITSQVILTYNVNADERIDAMDALSIVDFFLANKPYPIRQK